MRRTAVAVASTAAGIAAVVALHSSSPFVPLSSRPVSPPSTSKPSGGPTTSTASPGPPSSSGGADTTANGSSEQYGFGVLSVKVTARGHRIIDVSVSNLQTAEPYSQSLAQQVIPMLRGEVLSAQSASVNAVSGATYTSEAYIASVQSALDELHL